MGLDEFKSVGELFVFIIGMIAVAAVVRSDVKDLKKWRETHEKEVADFKESHGALHSNLAQLLTELKTLAIEQQRRIASLEDRRPNRK